MSNKTHQAFEFSSILLNQTPCYVLSSETFFHIKLDRPIIGSLFDLLDDFQGTKSHCGKTEKITLTENIFREINSSGTSFVKTLLSRIFVEKV